jgi:hypothetical protein
MARWHADYFGNFLELIRPSYLLMVVLALRKRIASFPAIPVDLLLLRQEAQQSIISSMINDRTYSRIE